MDGTLRVTKMSLQTRSVDIRSSDLASSAQAADLGQSGYPDSYARQLSDDLMYLLKSSLAPSTAKTFERAWKTFNMFAISSFMPAFLHNTSESLFDFKQDTLLTSLLKYSYN